MEPGILIGTTDGLWELGPDGGQLSEAMAGRVVTALARDGLKTWAIVDGRTIQVSDGNGWRTLASVEGPPATCLAPTSAGLLVGTEAAHLLWLANGRLDRVPSFEAVEGRETWYTPWGDPADVRSIAVDRAAAEAVYVNVHVGGVVRSRAGEGSWTPTLDIEVDVHQVMAHPACPGTVLVAAADGLGVSRDGGEAWEFVTAGMHAYYLRAVAVSEGMVLVSASTGHQGRRSAIYRRPLDGSAAFERCRQGLPEWFDDNIDTGCLAAAGPVVACGTEDGRVFRSSDGGAAWELVAKGLPAVRCLTVG